MVHALLRVAREARRCVRLVVAALFLVAVVSVLARPLPQTLAEYPVDTPPAAAGLVHPR